MKAITFYSYKGGVGRTLALANVAMRLAELGKKVCILDFDLEAPGVPFKFEQYLKPEQIKKGIVDYLYDFNVHGVLQPNITEYTTQINLPPQKYAPITLIPAGNTEDNEFWRKLASIDWFKFFYQKESHGIKFFLDLKNKIKKEIKPDFLLIDSRTGVTEISGVTLSLLADEAVIVSANNKENIDGSKRIIANLLSDSFNLQNKPIKVHFVLSRIPDDSPLRNKQILKIRLDEINQYLVSRKIEHQILEEKSLIIHSDPSLEIREEFKIGYRKSSTSNFADKNEFYGIKLQIAEDYLALFEQLTENEFSEEELEQLHKIKESEIYVERAKSVLQPFSKRLEFIDDALKLNPNNENALLQRGIMYFGINEYDEATQNIEQILNKNPSNIDALILIAQIAIRKKDYSKSLDIAERILALDENNFFALYYLYLNYLDKRDKEKTIELAKKLVAINYDSTSFKNLAHSYRIFKNLPKAKESIYKALQLDSQNWDAHLALAEINAAEGNDLEFYRNLEFCLPKLLLDEKYFIEDKIYHKYFKEERFINALRKRGIFIDPSMIASSK